MSIDRSINFLFYGSMTLMPRPFISPKLFRTSSNCIGGDQKRFGHRSKPIQKIKFYSGKLLLVWTGPKGFVKNGLDP